MEDFWQNIKDALLIFIKVAIIVLIIDIVLKIQEAEFRMPFASRIVDWIFFQIG